MIPRYFTSKAWRGIMAGVALMGAILGCANPQQRYKVLSFFFDGVPDPAAANVTNVRRGAGGRVVYIHQPYGEKKCDNCHVNSADVFVRANVQPNVCLKCHAAVQSEHKIMHGPVGATLCTYCHSPHTSPQAHLLKWPTPKLCTQCHVQDQLSVRISEHQNKKSDCLSCHAGHGGDDRRFLKAALEATTRPSTQFLPPPGQIP